MQSEDARETLTEGIHDDVPMAQYLADPCPEPSLSRSCLNTLITRTPQHAHMGHPRLGGHGGRQTYRADFGSAGHAMFRDPGAVQFVKADAWRTNAAKSARDSIRNQGKIPMLEKDAEALDAMSTIARKALDDKFGAGKHEQTFVWKENGVWCRARADYLSDNSKVIVDYKTTTNADPSTWIRTTLNHGGLDIQGVWYPRGVAAIKGEASREFVFLVQEIEPPYACSWVGLDAEYLDIARRKIELGIAIWKRCVESDDWPAYGDDIHWASEAPAYVTWDLEARIANQSAFG